VLSRIGWFLASGDERDAEILALRHQILVLQRQINRPRFTEADRTILAVLSGVFDRRRLAEVFPDREARHGPWVAPPSRRPPLDATAHPVRAPAGDRGDPPAGDPDGEGEPVVGIPACSRRIVRLGYRVAASSVWNILRSAGIDPTPNRTGPSWAYFIRSQARAIIATDFLCVTP